MAAESNRLDDAMLASILETRDVSASLAFDYGRNGVLAGAVELARILLYADMPGDRHMYRSRQTSAFDRWYDNLTLRCQRRVSVWIFDAYRSATWYFFENFGKRPEIRQIFEHILAQPVHPPYLYLFTLNMIKQIFGLSNDVMAEATNDRERLVFWLEEILQHVPRVLNWITERQEWLRFLGGSTNTILGYYTNYFRALSPRGDYAAYFDIGGGFSTSDIGRMTGRPFTSLDLLSPIFTDYDEKMVIRKRRPHQDYGCLNDEEMAVYLRRQSAVPWMKFDVAVDSIPAEFDSYFLTSTGFMTSTVRPNKNLREQWHPDSSDRGQDHVATSVVAMYRVIELVAAGKNVGLLSVSRASSRHYANAAVWLEWKNGRIAGYKTLPARRPPSSADIVVD